MYERSQGKLNEKGERGGEQGAIKRAAFAHCFSLIHREFLTAAPKSKIAQLFASASAFHPLQYVSINQRSTQSNFEEPQNAASQPSLPSFSATPSVPQATVDLLSTRS